jgi:hypothetical protein
MAGPSTALMCVQSEHAPEAGQSAITGETCHQKPPGTAFAHDHPPDRTFLLEGGSMTHTASR